MKSLFVVSSVPGEGARPNRGSAAFPERRKLQRRMGLARRTAPERRADSEASGDERRTTGDRRGFANRRRRPDRRIGLSPDLDVYLLGI